MTESLESRPAPDFSLPGSDGKTHSLRDYRGRVVILYFYPKDDTPGCTAEACGFRDLDKEIQATGAAILGISRDALDAHRAFSEKFNLPFILLSDTDAKVMTSYGAWGEKVLYGKPAIGTIRSTVAIGADGAVLKHWKRVSNAEKHPEDVLAFLGGLHR
jgi:peroxiredoxin Q/BCP